MLVLVSYDVSTIDKAGRTRLRRVAKMCQNYGQRVQLSVFECIIDPAQWTMLKKKLVDIINPEEDSLRFYFLGSNWRGKIEHIGIKGGFDQEGPLLV
ncbi:MAG: CRISPR-associated endonuclease Cas2 [Desulfoferrobacter sp.]